MSLGSALRLRGAFAILGVTSLLLFLASPALAFYDSWSRWATSSMHYEADSTVYGQVGGVHHYYEIGGRFNGTSLPIDVGAGYADPNNVDDFCYGSEYWYCLYRNANGDPKFLASGYSANGNVIAACYYGNCSPQGSDWLGGFNHNEHNTTHTLNGEGWA